jgi:demethylmenaquinone methyltransferase / 2-methoxy-6-polyprenyl-1,4-benzoquinol methylase
MNPTDTNTPTTHFGFQQVPEHEKAARVASVFHSVARNYDVMNDAMSLGLHRLWKRAAVDWLRLRAGMRVLDLASGTGDLAALMAPRVGAAGRVVMSDINASMLKQGWMRMTDGGKVDNIDYTLADAEQLPFPSHYFDRVTIAFGLRNVTHKARALEDICRVLKPGGMLLVLEFSQLALTALRPAYDWYSFNVLPVLGRWLANDADSYRYLAESIRMHPGQETLLQMLNDAGFGATEYRNLSAGIVAMHRGYKL